MLHTFLVVKGGKWLKCMFTDLLKKLKMCIHFFVLHCFVYKAVY